MSWETENSLKRKLEDVKRRKLEMLRAIKDYAATHRLEFFKPHPKQVEWFTALNDYKVKTVLFQAGNRAGKTSVALASVVALALGYYPWLSKTDKQTGEVSYIRTRFRPPIRIRCCGEDQGHHLREILVPRLREMLPPEAVASTRKNGAGLDAYWILKNGSSFEFMSYEQETDIFEGWDGHVVWFDEPPPRDKFVALKRGLVDHDGIMLLTFTPLKEPWIYDELVMNPDPSIRLITADTRDNPYLPPQAVNEFERVLSVEERTSRIKGGWLFLQGLVYKEFDRNRHIIEPMPKIPPDYSAYVAIDTHPRTEQALLFVVVDEKERVFVVEEKFSFGTPQEVADWIVEFHEKRHKLDGALIDPSAQGDRNRGDTTFDLIERRLSQASIPLELGSKDLSGGILKVKDALCSRNGQPSLFVYSTCKRLIYEFGRYIWDEWRDVGTKTAKQRPRDKDDHMLENLRRLIQHPVQYQSKSALRAYLDQASRPAQMSDPIAGY